VTSTSSDTPRRSNRRLRRSSYEGWVGQVKPQVTGLDPGSPPGGTTVPPANRLDSTDATFVRIIRTCAGIFMSKATTSNAHIGRVDFCPNRGLYQKGCLNCMQNNK
jgi:hypothetical protein